jgi:hypothetical protein
VYIDACHFSDIIFLFRPRNVKPILVFTVLQMMYTSDFIFIEYLTVSGLYRFYVIRHFVFNTKEGILVKTCHVLLYNLVSLKLFRLYITVFCVNLDVNVSMICLSLLFPAFSKKQGGYRNRLRPSVCPSVRTNQSYIIGFGLLFS